MGDSLFAFVSGAAAWNFATLRDLGKITICDICIQMAVKQQDKAAVGLQARNREPTTKRMKLSILELRAVEKSSIQQGK